MRLRMGSPLWKRYAQDSVWFAPLLLSRNRDGDGVRLEDRHLVDRHDDLRVPAGQDTLPYLLLVGFEPNSTIGVIQV